MSPEASEIAVEKGSPLYQQPLPRTIQLGEATLDESSTDPPPPPAFTETPVVPPRPSKSSASSSLASTPPKGEEGDDTNSENEEDDDDEDGDHSEAVSSSNAFSSQVWGPERTVEISRVPNQGLGISIVGGKVDPPPGSGHTLPVTGIFIKNVLEGCPAGQSGQLCTGDRILQVDGVDLRNASHDEAVDVIRQSGQVVEFVVQSLLSATTASGGGRGSADAATDRYTYNDIRDKSARMCLQKLL